MRRRWNPIAAAGAVRGVPLRGEPKLGDPLRHNPPKRTDAFLHVEPYAASVLDHSATCPQHRLLESMQVPTAMLGPLLDLRCGFGRIVRLGLRTHNVALLLYPTERLISMATAPLFLKYRTSSGTCYAYDANTNEIVRVAEIVYAILNDYRVLDSDSLIEKYHTLGEASVRRAIAELEGLQARGILRDHAPSPTIRADRVSLHGNEEPLKGFLESHSRLLTLELTEACNLRCEYCTYGEHYSDRRAHGTGTMSFETATKVIDEFVARNPEKCSIGFYGGEPLLEYDLLQQIVGYAEKVAAERGQWSRLGACSPTNGDSPSSR